MRGFAGLSTPSATPLSANPFVYTCQGAGHLVTQITLPTNAKVVRGYDTLGRFGDVTVSLPFGLTFSPWAAP
jgi:hypothetical protein